MPTANSSHFLFGFCFGSLLIKLDPSLLQSLSVPLFAPTSPVSLCLPSAFSLSFLFLFGEDNVDPPCSLPLTPPMKGSGSSQPGNCSALLPLSASFPQPFLAVQQPLAQCLFKVPSSSWRKVRGKRLGFPMGFHPPVPIHGQRPCSSPESHLTSLAVPP